MSFKDYIINELNQKSKFVLSRGLQEMHDAPDQQVPALSKETVERILAQYQKQEDPDMTHNDAIFFGDNPEGRSRVQKYAPIEDNPKDSDELKEATMIPSAKEAAVAFATHAYNKKHGTDFSKHDVHGYLFGNQASDELHDHVASNYNTEDPKHIQQAFGLPHDHPALSEENLSESEEVDMDDHEQLHAHVHNAISSGYDLELELADGTVVYIEPHQLQHFKNKNAIPQLFGSLGSQQDFQNYLNSVYAETEPTAKHGPDPDPYKDVVPSPDKAMEVHDRPDPVMESLKGAPIDKYIADFLASNAPQFKGKSKEKIRQMAIGAYYANEEGGSGSISESDLSKLGREQKLASVEPGESITVNVPKRGLISGKIKAIKGNKTIIVDQEGKEHEVET